jgi:hypothetical protein
MPPRFAYVQDYLVQFDADLRIRRSAELPHMFVLERRIRNRPAANLGMRDLSDMHVQARDGYIHISTVHPQWLERPWNIVRELKEVGADLWDEGGYGRVTDELEYEEAWAQITRRRRRLQMFREIALDGYDVLSRLNINGERSRISAPGLPNAHRGALTHSDILGASA